MHLQHALSYIQVFLSLTQSAKALKFAALQQLRFNIVEIVLTAVLQLSTRNIFLIFSVRNYAHTVFQRTAYLT